MQSSGAGDDIVNGENSDDIIIQNGSGTQYYDGGEGVGPMCWILKLLHCQKTLL